MPKRQAEPTLTVREEFLKNIKEKLAQINDAEACLCKAVLLRNSYFKVSKLPKHGFHDSKRPKY